MTLAVSVLSSIPSTYQSPQVIHSQLPSLDKWDPRLWVGKRLSGYLVVDVIGKGGESYVLKGVDSDGKEYAIKIPKISTSSSEVAKKSKFTFKSLKDESDALQRLSENNAGIVKIFAISLDTNVIDRVIAGKAKEYLENPPMIVLKYMKGGTLDKMLGNRVLSVPQWEKLMKRIFSEIAGVLIYLHTQGYVHLDQATEHIPRFQGLNYVDE